MLSALLYWLSWVNLDDFFTDTAHTMSSPSFTLAGKSNFPFFSCFFSFHFFAFRADLIPALIHISLISTVWFLANCGSDFHYLWVSLSESIWKSDWDKADSNFRYDHSNKTISHTSLNVPGLEGANIFTTKYLLYSVLCLIYFLEDSTCHFITNNL